ncbi:hypothetical protein [Eikenella corrodens]|uniref:Uncharacterized protein n=1 Tax=Eikenella corrodens TaxID=539 RepID=A0A3S9SHZ8_EIKCO|nr:hypothetical protein [Eikenella corrodens]AZR59165.1 hypothetical protein ELB75_03440 [Eikenella corrodens]
MSKNFRVLEASVIAIITALAAGAGLGAAMLLVVGFGVCLGTFDGDADGTWWAVIALAMAGALVMGAVVFINVYSAEDKKQEGKRRVRIRRR